MCSIRAIAYIIMSILLAPLCQADEVDFRVMPRVHQELPPDVWEAHSATDEDGEVLVVFHVDYLGAVSEISVLQSHPPGVWDNWVIEQVRELRFKYPRAGKRQMIFSVSKQRN